jgi:hypothetical protein
MIEIAASARRHGVSDNAMRHAPRNAIRFAPTPDPALVLYIGPDETGHLLELGVLMTDDGPIVIHAMAARVRFLR